MTSPRLVGAWETAFGYHAISRPLYWNGSEYWTTAHRALVTAMTPPIMSQRPACRPGTSSPNVPTMPCTLGMPRRFMIVCTVTGPSPLTLPSGLMMLAGGSLARPILITPARFSLESRSFPPLLLLGEDPPPQEMSRSAAGSVSAVRVAVRRKERRETDRSISPDRPPNESRVVMWPPPGVLVRSPIGGRGDVRA